MKPDVQALRLQSFQSVNYWDDFLLLADSAQDCLFNLKITLKFLQFVGFKINEEKSKLLPETKQKFLGFIIDTWKREKILELTL